MKKEIQDLVELSRSYGGDPDFIIAGGGNTSYKTSDRIWVKASGTSMADIDESGFVCLDRKKLNVLSIKEYSRNSADREQEVKKDLANAILFPRNKRPSVETSMHEIIDFPFVVHTHPTLVCGLLCAKDSKAMVSKLFGENCLYIEYNDPGYVLFKTVEDALLSYREKKEKIPSIIFLENHGVFVAANTVEEINEHYKTIVQRISDQITEYPDTSGKRADSNLNTVIESLSEHPETKDLVSIQLANKLTDRFVSDKMAFEKVSVPFTPDNIVYCKSKYLFVENCEAVIRDIMDFRERNGFLPKVIALKGCGIIALEENMKSARIVVDVFEDMMKVSYYTESFGGPRPMTDEQIQFIDNWEVENYRRQVSKSK